MEDFVVATLPENDPITIIMQTGYKFGYDTGFKAGVESVQHKVGVGENLISRTDAIQGAAEKVQNAPAVDAEPVRHGQWISKKVDAIETEFQCSKCGRTVECGNDYFGKPTKHISSIFPYCHCGAKMDAEVSE